MTRKAQFVHREVSAKVVAERLAAGRVSALPVLDDDRRVVGLVSESDLLHKITYQDENGDWPRFLQRHRADRVKAGADSAEALMTAPAVTIGPDASLSKAARLMADRAIKTLPVVDAAGVLLGVVSRGDLISVFTRPDEDILHEVTTEIFGRILLLTPGTASAAVANGVVTLSGVLPRKVEAEVAAEVTRRVEGVVGVDNQLTYRLDDTSYRAVRDADAPRGVFY